MFTQERHELMNTRLNQCLYVCLNSYLTLLLLFFFLGVRVCQNLVVVRLHTTDAPDANRKLCIKAGIFPHELLKLAFCASRTQNPAVLEQIY